MIHAIPTYHNRPSTETERYRYKSKASVHDYGFGEHGVFGNAVASLLIKFQNIKTITSLHIHSRCFKHHSIQYRTVSINVKQNTNRVKRRSEEAKKKEDASLVMSLSASESEEANETANAKRLLVRLAINAKQ